MPYLKEEDKISYSLSYKRTGHPVQWASLKPVDKKSTPRMSKLYHFKYITLYASKSITYQSYFISCLTICPNIIQPSASLTPLGCARRETRSLLELKLQGPSHTAISQNLSSGYLQKYVTKCIYKFKTA